MPTLVRAQEYLEEQLEIIESIPEGMWVNSFPAHDESPLCWCRPRVTFLLGEMVLEHKNLLNGEFDS